MTEEGLRIFLQSLAIDTSDIKRYKNWLMLTCPLAFHTHGSGVDSHPSFFISISEQHPSVWHCFGCTDKPSGLIKLLHNIWLMTGEYPKEAAHIYTQYEIIADDESIEKIIYSDIWNNYKPKKVNKLPPQVLTKFPLLSRVNNINTRRCKEYLQSRGIGSHIWNMCGIRYDGRDNLIFPFTNILGEIYMLRVRKTYTKQIWSITSTPTRFTNVDFPTIRDVGIFFGMHLVDFSKPVLLVEAEIDAMRLMSLGCFNVMASGTCMITPIQIKSIFADSVVLGYDADVAGRKAHKRIKDFIDREIILHELTWDIVLSKDGQPCKDAGDLTRKEDLIKVLKNKKTY